MEHTHASKLVMERIAEYTIDSKEEQQNFIGNTKTCGKSFKLFNATESMCISPLSRKWYRLL
jgi:hypothetical protein